MANLNNEKIKQLKQQRKDMNKEIAVLQGNGTDSRLKNVLLLLAFITLFLGILTGMIKADVGGFGSGILAPVIGNVNGLNKILPAKSLSSSVAKDPSATTDKSSSIADSSSATDSPVVTTTTTDTSKAAGKQSATKGAKAAASSQTAIKAKAAAGTQAGKNNQTVSNPQTNAGSQTGTVTQNATGVQAAAGVQTPAGAQAGSVTQNAAGSQTNAAAQTADAQAAEKAKLSDFVDTYSKMDAKSAASILGNMTGDLHLVAKILTNMRASKRADIMANLNVNLASKLTVLMGKQ
ncbi:MotE family protein [Anaerocolumna jejuensis]|uniref:MotE family protein n=1 Tax=Anaerocolumna jejuensis TaxID=259063 RepID=UPI003F7C2412